VYLILVSRVSWENIKIEGGVQFVADEPSREYHVSSTKSQRYHRLILSLTSDSDWIAKCRRSKTHAHRERKEKKRKKKEKKMIRTGGKIIRRRTFREARREADVTNAFLEVVLHSESVLRCRLREMSSMRDCRSSSRNWTCRVSRHPRKTSKS